MRERVIAKIEFDEYKGFELKLLENLNDLEMLDLASEINVQLKDLFDKAYNKFYKKRGKNDRTQI